MPRLTALRLTLSLLAPLIALPALAQAPSLCQSRCQAELQQCRKEAMASRRNESGLPAYASPREPSQIGDYNTVADAARRLEAGIQGRLQERYTDCQNAQLRCVQDCGR